MTKHLQVAIEVAHEAGLIQKKYHGKLIKIGYKGTGKNDVVTEVDKKCEAYIVKQLNKAFPDYAVLAEEGTNVDSRVPYKWIIDPLDATVNYSHGHPVFAVSIGLEYKGKIIAGACYSTMLDEMYYAEKGKGAFLNGRKIQVSKTKSLETSLLCTGFAYDVKTNPDNNLNNFAKFILNSQALRRDGSAVIDLCYVACGRYEGFWELNLKPWDVAAATLIIQEAGGKVTRFDGSKFSIYGNQVLASNGKVHKEMMRVLQEASQK
jgi:myo-inositol-1(or 4)-monophosphatase